MAPLGNRGGANAPNGQAVPANDGATGSTVAATADGRTGPFLLAASRPSFNAEITPQEGAAPTATTLWRVAIGPTG